MGKKTQAAQLVSKSCYKSALKMLWSAKGARKPMMEFWTKQLKEEVRGGCSCQVKSFQSSQSISCVIVV